NEVRDSIADVFFIHPTTYTDARLGWNAGINDAYINAKTDYSSILYQSTVFNQHCRIFAPRYRQVHLSFFFTKNEKAQPALDTALADIKNAFNYYMEHFNHGRPIIIAGHSQGGLMALQLLQEYFEDNPELRKKLVAAYIIGWPVPEKQLTSIPVCSDSMQTGCFTSWRTYKTNYIPSYIRSEPGMAVTNPLTWTLTGENADPSLNAGSVLRDFNKVITSTAGARIHHNIVWTDKPRFPGSFFFRTKNYHIGDINLYYMNIRKNVEQRILAWLMVNR
ncbi:MAG TPA: DUF3089 domain-containing protein, partial [Flavisolibacter sp.]